MNLPRFLLGDNTDFPEDVFIIHLEFPRFVLNVASGEVEWLEEFSSGDQEEIQKEGHKFIEEAMTYYERELKRYSDD